MKVAKSVYMDVKFWEWVNKSKTKDGSKNEVVERLIMIGLKEEDSLLYKELKEVK